MDLEKLKRDVVLSAWDCFERGVTHYSFLMKILDCMGRAADLLLEGPRIFVEELGFELCKIIYFTDSQQRESVFCIEQDLEEGLSYERVCECIEGKGGPVYVSEAFKVPVLIYPLREGTEKKSLLILGSRTEREGTILRELEILVQFYSMCLECEDRYARKKEITLSYRAILDALPFYLFLADEDGRVLFVNAKAQKGFSGKGILGGHMSTLLPCLTPEMLRAGEPLSKEISFHESGLYKAFALQLVPFGRHRIVLLSDLSERKVLEEKEIRRSKIETLGLLAGGFAHDFNNVLTGILGYASLLKEALKDNEKLLRFAEVIESSAQRGAKLTQHLLNFYKRRKRSFGPVNVNVVLEDVLFLLNEGLKEIEVVKELDPDIPVIKADESGLQQVFLNLCINAREAMEGKGVLKVKTGTKRYLRNKEYLYVCIEDTGKGMDEQTRVSIFEPFFSTKERERSLGLGLYIVKGIVKEHRGFIDVESKEGVGTKFYIYLPVETTERQVEEKKNVKEEKPMRKTVLVVDDEAVVRELLRDLLVSQGFDVMEASHGKESLEMLEKWGGEINVVILDLLMPGMKGDEVLVKMKEMKRGVKVILSSGFMSEDQRKKMERLGADGFLDKPYRAEQVRELLSSLFSL